MTEMRFEINNHTILVKGVYSQSIFGEPNPGNRRTDEKINGNHSDWLNLLGYDMDSLNREDLMIVLQDHVGVNSISAGVLFSNHPEYRTGANYPAGIYDSVSTLRNGFADGYTLILVNSGTHLGTDTYVLEMKPIGEKIVL